ncbi:unnamed protein product, partial [Effrenium voratum]
KELLAELKSFEAEESLPLEERLDSASEEKVSEDKVIDDEAARFKVLWQALKISALSQEKPSESDQSAEPGDLPEDDVHPEVQALRLRVQVARAAQEPLKRRANELQRCFHHQRALLEAARQGSERAKQVADRVRQAQVLAEIRVSYSQAWQMHAHAIAENLDLKEKLRASRERSARLAEEIAELQEKSGLSPKGPGLVDIVSLAESEICHLETGRGEKLDMRSQIYEKGALPKSWDNLYHSVQGEGEVSEQPEPEPLKSPQVLPAPAELVPQQWLPLSGEEEVPDSQQEQEAIPTLRGRSQAAKQMRESPSGRCWKAKPGSAAGQRRLASLASQA